MRLRPLWFVGLNPLRGRSGMKNIQRKLQGPWGRASGGCGDRIGSCVKNMTEHHNTLPANTLLCVRRNTALTAVVLDHV